MVKARVLIPDRSRRIGGGLAIETDGSWGQGAASGRVRNAPAEISASGSIHASPHPGPVPDGPLVDPHQFADACTGPAELPAATVRPDLLLAAMQLPVTVTPLFGVEGPFWTSTPFVPPTNQFPVTTMF